MKTGGGIATKSVDFNNPLCIVHDVPLSAVQRSLTWMMMKMRAAWEKGLRIVGGAGNQSCKLLLVGTGESHRAGLRGDESHLLIDCSSLRQRVVGGLLRRLGHRTLRFDQVLRDLKLQKGQEDHLKRRRRFFVS